MFTRLCNMEHYNHDDYCFDENMDVQYIGDVNRQREEELVYYKPERAPKRYISVQPDTNRPKRVRLMVLVANGCDSGYESV